MRDNKPLLLLLKKRRISKKANLKKANLKKANLKKENLKKASPKAANIHNRWLSCRRQRSLRST